MLNHASFFKQWILIMRRFITTFLFGLLCSISIHAAQDNFQPAIDHSNCGYFIVSFIFNGTTVYKQIPFPSLQTLQGNLHVCQQATKANIPKHIHLANILCDRTHQFIVTQHLFSHKVMLVLINDEPIVDEPHSEQAPQG